MNKIILIISLVFLVVGFSLSDFATEQAKAGSHIFIIVFWLPILGLIMIWAVLIKLMVERKKENILNVSVKLPEKKPRICWDPKYQLKVQAPSQFIKSVSPINYLSNIFETMDFIKKQEDTDFIIFERGSIFNIFTFNGRKMKLCVLIQKPFNNSITLYIKYGLMMLDTGDLWEFTKELEHKLIIG